MTTATNNTPRTVTITDENNRALTLTEIADGCDVEVRQDYNTLDTKSILSQIVSKLPDFRQQITSFGQISNEDTSAFEERFNIVDEFSNKVDEVAVREPGSQRHHSYTDTMGLTLTNRVGVEDTQADNKFYGHDHTRVSVWIERGHKSSGYRYSYSDRQTFKPIPQYRHDEEQYGTKITASHTRHDKANAIEINGAKYAAKTAKSETRTLRLCVQSELSDLSGGNAKIKIKFNTEAELLNAINKAVKYIKQSSTCFRQNADGDSRLVGGTILREAAHSIELDAHRDVNFVWQQAVVQVAALLENDMEFNGKWSRISAGLNSMESGLIRAVASKEFDDDNEHNSGAALIIEISGNEKKCVRAGFKFGVNYRERTHSYRDSYQTATLNRMSTPAELLALANRVLAFATA